MDTKTRFLPSSIGTASFRFENCWQGKRRAKTLGRIRFLQRLLDTSLQRPPSRIPNCQLVDAKLELERLLRANEIYWAQRSRVQWLANGDKNSCFFHSRANARRKKNTVTGLYNTDNVWKVGTASVLNIAVDYFFGLFTSSSFENSEILNHILPVVTSDMNASLLRTFTADEVVTAFREIGHGKAPGIDGFPSSFFRLHWNTIGSDFTQLCLDLLHGSADMASINHTVIVLIPKVASPDYMRQFRPISLYNILIAHELIHSLSSIGTGPYQGDAVKLDIKKAFDRVEWNFLRDVMLRLEFDSSWVSLILRYITTVSFTVRINGCLSQDFQPQRGLRQGDPLSPFLFLICTQALSSLLTAEQFSGGLTGLCASRNGPRINRLLFADDSLIFIRNSTTEALRLKHILHIYGQASGQRVNYDKSDIFFCPKICQQARDVVSVILGVHEVTDPGVYLGVPLSIGQNKTIALGFICDNVNSSIASWNKQLLSFGGREISIKAWSGSDNRRGWHLLNWESVCAPKNSGGMGFRNLHLFNIALLGKQIWQLISAPDFLFARVFRDRYFPSGKISDATCNMRASFSWKGLFRAFQYLKSGFMWRPGINSDARIHQDCWGGNIPVQHYGDYEDDSELPIRCRHFMIPNCPLWDACKISAYFSSDDALSILRIPIQDSLVDTLIWYHHDSGIYFIRSGYSFLQRPPAPINRPSGLWKILAKLPVLPKIRTFGWRATHDALPTGDRLRNAKLGDGFCPFCSSVLETPLHYLRECPGAMDALQLAGFIGSNFGLSTNFVFGYLESAAATLSRDSFLLLLTILWNLWNRRNDFVHTGRLQPSWLIVMNSKLLLADYKYGNTLSSTSPLAPPF
ncbi:hypothetical protein GQ457_04G024640 [Hibiscus cannabinus]